jgi:hypothetical protein
MTTVLPAGGADLSGVVTLIADGAVLYLARLDWAVATPPLLLLDPDDDDADALAFEPDAAELEELEDDPQAASAAETANALISAAA